MSLISEKEKFISRTGTNILSEELFNDVIYIKVHPFTS